MELSRHLPDHVRDMRRIYMVTIQANKLSLFFGQPIYLVGSALDVTAKPRDWDLRLCLPDEHFAIKYCYGSGQFDVEQMVSKWLSAFNSGVFIDSVWRWGDDMVHHSMRASKGSGALIDFQVYPEKHWSHYDDQPRCRIDTRSDVDLR